MTNKTILEAQAEALETVWRKYGNIWPTAFVHVKRAADALRAQAAAEQPEKEGEEPKVVAWLLLDQGCRAPDDCEDYERVELASEFPASELERFLKAGRATPLVTCLEPLEIGAGPLSVNLGALEKAVNEYVENYEMTDGEVSHIPDENERALILDAIHGLLVDEAFDAAFGPVSAHHPDSGEFRAQAVPQGWKLVPTKIFTEIHRAWAISICAVRPNTCGLDDEMECVREMFDGHSTIQELLASTPPVTDSGEWQSGVHVRFAEMRESNGRVTWFVSLARSEDATPMDCHQVYSSNIKGCAEYERDALKHFLGQGPVPDILAYDTDAPKDRQP